MIRFVGIAGAVVFLSALPVVIAGAQSPGNVTVATAKATVKPAAVAPGGKGMLFVTVAVAPRFHINAHKPNDPDLIPTTFTGAGTPGVALGAAKFPTPKTIKESYETLPMPVYQGRTVIAVPFTVAKTARPGKITLGGTLGYQGCNETSCYPPTSATVKAVVTIK